MKIVAKDGCRIEVRELRTAGAGAPVVVLVHALAMHGGMWRRVADEMRATARVLAIDCRGHGDSDKPAGPYTTDLFAQDLRDVADAFGLGAFTLGGCSMGGTVAQAFAGRYPPRVSGLLLVDTTCWYGAMAAEAWETRAAKALDEGFAAMLAFQRERWFSPEFIAARPEVLREAVDIFLRNDPRAYAETCRMLGRADERERIARYRGPATVLVGEDDFATPPVMAAEIAARIPGTVMQVIPRARHFTPFETPAVIAAELDALITTTIEEKS